MKDITKVRSCILLWQYTDLQPDGSVEVSFVGELRDGSLVEFWRDEAGRVSCRRTSSEGPEDLSDISLALDLDYPRMASALVVHTAARRRAPGLGRRGALARRPVRVRGSHGGGNAAMTVEAETVHSPAANDRPRPDRAVPVLSEPELDASVLRGLEALARLGERLVLVDRSRPWTGSCECMHRDVVAAVEYVRRLAGWMQTRSRGHWLGSFELI